MLTIQNHKLVKDGSAVKFKALSDKGGKFKPCLIIVHFTGGGSAESSIGAMEARNVSAHAIVDRDGSITQLVPFNEQAWHAGPSNWRGKGPCNPYAFGIEIANYGWLNKTGSGGYSAYGHPIAADHVILAQHKNGNPTGVAGAIPWEEYTPEQIAAVSDIIAALKQYCPDIIDVVGHDDVAPVRKSDPGPAAPMNIWKGALGSDRNVNKIDYWRVNSKTGLNLRAGPGANWSIIELIPNNTKLIMLKRDGDWYNVTAANSKNTGWVHGSYIVDI